MVVDRVVFGGAARRKTGFAAAARLDFVFRRSRRSRLCYVRGWCFGGPASGDGGFSPLNRPTTRHKFARPVFMLGLHGTCHGHVQVDKHLKTPIIIGSIFQSDRVESNFPPKKKIANDSGDSDFDQSEANSIRFKVKK